MKLCQKFSVNRRSVRKDGDKIVITVGERPSAEDVILLRNILGRADMLMTEEMTEAVINKINSDVENRKIYPIYGNYDKDFEELRYEDLTYQDQWSCINEGLKEFARQGLFTKEMCATDDVGFRDTAARVLYDDMFDILSEDTDDHIRAIVAKNSKYYKQMIGDESSDVKAELMARGALDINSEDDR